MPLLAAQKRPAGWPEQIAESGLKIVPQGLQMLSGLAAQIKKMGILIDPKAPKGALGQLIDFIENQFDAQSTALFATARLWDDGIIDPRDTRSAWRKPSICKDAEHRTLYPSHFGVAQCKEDRMRFQESHTDIRDTVRNFVINDLNPYVDEWEEAKIFPAHEVFKMGDLGLLGVSRDEAYGGLGLDYSHSMVMAEELGICRAAAVSMAIGVPQHVPQPLRTMVLKL